MSATSDRAKCIEAGYDWLVIRVSLRKLDRNTLTLHDARARVTSNSGESLHRMVSFWGTDRFAHVVSGSDGHHRVVWDVADPRDPRLNLTPGEEAQLAAFVRVPTGEPCHVDVVVLGAHFDQNLHCGQWKASAVSLPIA